MNVTAIQAVEERPAEHLRVLRRSDPLLLLAGLGIVACSLITLKGATANMVPGRPLYYVERQGIYAAVGVAIVLMLAHIDYTRLRRLKYVLYGLTLLLNLAVLGVGSTVQGGRRWLPLPLFQFQPSEFGKLLVILSLAAFVVDRSRRLHERSTTVRIMLLALIPALVVIPQPDLGTALVYVTIGFVVLFVAGTSWKHLLGLAVLAVAAIVIVLVVAPALGVHVLNSYQEQRLTGFLHPSQNPQSQTWNIHQSLIAIGSGGKLGQGAHATQTRLGYLPAPSTDFVFAALGETYGFVGGAVVLSLYALLIWRTLRVITLSKNLYGTIIAGGILAMFMFQVFVNVGMTIGIMPITGVPLPLLSYGGSSVLVTLIAIGLLESIHVQARFASESKSRSLVS